MCLWLEFRMLSCCADDSFAQYSNSELSVGWVDPRVGLGHGSETADLRKNTRRLYMKICIEYQQANSRCSTVHCSYGRPIAVRYVGFSWVWVGLNTGSIRLGRWNTDNSAPINAPLGLNASTFLATLCLVVRFTRIINISVKFEGNHKCTFMPCSLVQVLFKFTYFLAASTQRKWKWNYHEWHRITACVSTFHSVYQ